MAIELPGPVADFLNFIGIAWPNVNEDKVREFGEHVTAFGQALQASHGSSTGTISQLASSYQGAAYEQLFTKWGQMSSEHMSELITGCQVVGEALDVGSDAIIGMKVAALAQLAVLAAEFIADQAASVATLGLAEAALALIEEQGQMIVRFLEQELEQYIIGQIINAAVGPLIGKVETAVEGLVYKGVEGALGVSGGGAGSSIQINPSGALAQAQQLRAQGDELLQTAQGFGSSISGLSFE